jgi:hypothetical protein
VAKEGPVRRDSGSIKHKRKDKLNREEKFLKEKIFDKHFIPASLLS